MILGSLFSDMIFFRRFMSFLSVLEILASRFSRFELSPNPNIWLELESVSSPKGSSLLKHLMQKKDSLLSSSHNSSYLLADILLHLMCTQLSHISQHTALAFPRMFLLHYVTGNFLLLFFSFIHLKKFKI